MPTLQKISINGIIYFIDFRLRELRDISDPHAVIKFSDLDESIKKELRQIRAAHYSNDFIKELQEAVDAELGDGEKEHINVVLYDGRDK